MEEFLELFKGQISYVDLKNNMTHKEAMALRDARIERLKREKMELDAEREKIEKNHNMKKI